MKQNNKPQWLIDAENEINNAKNTEYGKLTEKQFNKKMNGEFIGKLAIDSGQLDSVRNPSAGGKAAKLVNAQSKAGIAAKKVNAQSKAGKIGGKIGGKKHVESGHLDNIRHLAIASSVKSRMNLKQSKVSKLYDNIDTNDWFTMDQVLEFWNITDENNILLKSQTIFNYLKKVDFFESKVLNIDKGKKKYYKKIVN